MSKKLFVGNIEWATTEEELNELFAQYGTVEEAIIIKDRMSGRPKGFGFVTFSTEEESQAAIAALHEFDFNGRNLVVNEARPQEPR